MNDHLREWFLGLARASRTALTPALPAFALVLALTIAAFAGMVRDAVTNGEVAASWQTAGADAMVTPAPNLIIAPNAVRAMADVPGVTHAAEVWNALWETPADTQLNVLAVDPAGHVESQLLLRFAAARVGGGLGVECRNDVA